MAVLTWTSSLWTMIALAYVPRPASSANLSVSIGSGQPLSPLLHGLMFEDISHSIDGGLHGQLLRNNGFQGNNPGLAPWTSFGNCEVSQDFGTPLTTAIKSTLNITVPDGASGLAGVENDGYLGITIIPGYYTSSFFIKGDYTGNITIRLSGKTSGVQYAWGTVPVTSIPSEFTEVKVSIRTPRAPDGSNVWHLEFDASIAAGKSLNVGLPQLFPPTFNDRENGLNQKLAQPLADLKPKYLRFPGGNNLEGISNDERWKWNETLGPVQDRPGRQGTWGYANTDAMGLMEYLYMCEDMSMTPVLAVWAGLSFGDPAVVGDALEPFIDDVLAEIEFVTGNINTPGGAWRASLGHPEPFELQFIEVGNEDNLGAEDYPGCPTYPERLSRFYTAIKARYPSITVIASTVNTTCLPDPIPDGLWLDFHDYNVPENYVPGFTQFDSWDPAHPIMIGEYARWEERNPQIVRMASYAPTFQLVDNSSWQWTPNLISFTQGPDNVVTSVSYEVMKMFSTNHGDTVLPVTADVQFGPVYWSASRKGKSTYIVKLANYSEDLQVIYVKIPGKTVGWYTVVSSAPDDMNTVDNPHAITPNSWTEKATNNIFRLEVGQYGVAVLVTN